MPTAHSIGSGSFLTVELSIDRIPTLWQNHSNQQVYMTALQQASPTTGPAITFSAAIPDLHHYKGSFGGRVFPLWADRRQRRPNLKAGVLREVRRHSWHKRQRQ